MIPLGVSPAGVREPGDPAGPGPEDAAVHTEVATRIDRAVRPLAEVLFSSVRRRLGAPVPA